MSLPASNEAVVIAPGAAVGAVAWPRARAVPRAAALGIAIAWLAACGSAPQRPAAKPAAVRVPAPAPVPAAAPALPPPASAAGASAPVAAPHPEVPDAARADFDRAVNLMRAGNTSGAELGFKQMAQEYPQFAAPLVNLAILKRKQGQLPEAEQLLKTAVAHESGNAVAWTELGATQSLRAQFKDAANSYQAAITADPRYAPAWRNLGVVADLYLDDPRRALSAFEQYKELSGEDKPVSGWIAELHQRLGIAPAKRPATQAPDAAPTPAAAPGTTVPARGGN
jgi:tetratricopeptide (TPR) repeat protein